MQQQLKQVFGFDQFRPGQAPTIQNILDGHSAAAIFPTGSGKSLCYQLPALMLPHLTLVVSPLIALMKDQLAFLQRKGIPAAVIDSSLSYAELQEVWQDLRAGKLKILMVAVERFKNERFRQSIQSIPISLLVIDEAHCISEWGHNFRPDYLKLPQYQRDFNISQTLLLTATATPTVIEDMTSKFGIATTHVHTTGFYRPNLRLNIIGVSETDKLARLITYLQQETEFKPSCTSTTQSENGEQENALVAPTIVYVTLQHEADEVATALVKHGFNAKAYHAGLDNEIRSQIQNEFMADQVEIIVATIAFGMGVDKSNIRNVIHFDLPKSIETYSQEIGRAGRDGKPSDCLLLANRDKTPVLENFVYGDTPEQSEIIHVLQNIVDGSEGQTGGEWHVQLYRLSNESNIRQLTLKTLLVYLEIQGVIKPKAVYFAEYRFKLLVEQADIIAAFEGERREFIEAIFHNSHKKKTWWDLDFDAIYRNYRAHDASRGRVVTAIDYLVQKNWMTVESKQLTEIYSVLRPDIQVDKLASEIAATFKQKQDVEVKRIHTMLSIFESPTCLSHQLAHYFGDNNAPSHCGHCHVCVGQLVVIPEPPAQHLPDIQVARQLTATFMDSFRKERFEMPSADLLTKFLCGISVPIFTKLKARKLNGFGQLAGVSYQQVKALSVQLLA